MNSMKKEASLTPIPWEEWEGLHGDLPDGGRVFVKMNTTPILAGPAKTDCSSIVMESTLARWKCDECPRMVEWGNSHAKWNVEKTSRQYFNEIAPFLDLDDSIEKLGYPVESPLGNSSILE